MSELPTASRFLVFRPQHAIPRYPCCTTLPGSTSLLCAMCAVIVGSYTLCQRTWRNSELHIQYMKHVLTRVTSQGQGNSHIYAKDVHRYRELRNKNWRWLCVFEQIHKTDCNNDIVLNSWTMFFFMYKIRYNFSCGIIAEDKLLPISTCPTIFYLSYNTKQRK